MATGELRQFVNALLTGEGHSPRDRSWLRFLPPCVPPLAGGLWGVRWRGQLCSVQHSAGLAFSQRSYMK